MLIASIFQCITSRPHTASIPSIRLYQLKVLTEATEKQPSRYSVKSSLKRIRFVRKTFVRKVAQNIAHKLTSVVMRKQFGTQNLRCEPKCFVFRTLSTYRAITCFFSVFIALEGGSSVLIQQKSGLFIPA